MSLFTFEYSIAERLRYKFSYRREMAQSNVSMFNSPVAVIKKVAGVFTLQELFAETPDNQSDLQDIEFAYKDSPKSNLALDSIASKEENIFNIDDLILASSHTINAYLNHYYSGTKINWLGRIPQNELASRLHAGDFRILENYLLSPRVKDFKILDNELAITDTNHLDLMNGLDEILATSFHRALEIIDEDLQGSIPRNLQIFENLNLKRPDINHLAPIPLEENFANKYIDYNLYFEWLTADKPINQVLHSESYNYNLFGSKNILTSQLNEHLSLFLPNPIVNYYFNVFGSKSDNITNWFPELHGTKLNLGLNKWGNLFVKYPDKIVNWYEQILTTKSKDFIIQENESEWLSKNISTNEYDHVWFKFLSDKRLFNESYYTSSFLKPTKDKNIVNVIDQLYAQKNKHVVDVSDILAGSKALFNAFVDYYDHMLYPPQIKYGYLHDDFSLKPKDKRHGYLQEILSVDKKSFNGYIPYNDAFGNKSQYLGFLDYEETSLDKKLKYGYISESINTNKIFERGFIDDSYLSIHRTSYQLPNYPWDNINIKKTRHGMKIADDSFSIFKIPKDMTFWDKTNFYPVNIYKLAKDFSINDTAFNIFKIQKDIDILDLAMSIYKVKKDMEIIKWWESATTFREMIIHDSSFFVDKSARRMDRIISGIHLEKLFKEVAVTNPDPSIFEEQNGFIFPVSKLQRPTFVDDVNEWLDKSPFSSGLSYQELFGSVIPKSSDLGDITSLDKLPLKGFMDIQEEWIKKERLRTYIQDNEVWSSKSPLKGFITDQLWINKKPLFVFETKEEWTSKASKKGDIFKQEWSAKLNKEAFLYDQVWSTKTPKFAYYTYQTFAEKLVQNAKVSDEVWTFKDLQKTMVNYENTLSFKKIPDGWVDHYVFAKKDIDFGQVFSELEWLPPEQKGVQLRPEDFGNWVFVWETPDPFDSAFGIDELLLPENDIRYEDFKEKIFDFKYMRPKHVVEQINETKWIAKYPIKHPIQGPPGQDNTHHPNLGEQWAEVAKNYDDSAFDWENYYGISTGIMYEMFLKYYRIWQVNMYKFANYTMQDSVNLMLKYMWEWIPTYYNGKDLEQAYRVFKLIRWFGECAILNNSRYIISYEYDDGGIKKKYNPKTKQEEYGIYGITTDLYDINEANRNETMSFNREGGYIYRNPAYSGKGLTYVNFFVKVVRTTYLRFDLRVTPGYATIYIDNKEYRKVSNTDNIEIPLQYTGSIVNIRVECPAECNTTNGVFLIDGLRIPEQDFKDLTIEFDPDIRSKDPSKKSLSGNKPLKEIAEKLVAYANLHENRDEAWQKILGANLGVEETYRQMLKYWENHHADKWKGKRLTIKEV